MPSTEEIDFTHLLYLHPSDMPGLLLISQPLIGLENYCVWSRSLKIALLAKNKLGFIDGSCQRSDYSGALQVQWDRCNAVVLSWILNVVSKDLSAELVFASGAASVWNDLQERFYKIDGSRIFFLHREIATLYQGEYTISAFFTRLKMLWDEYESLIPFTACDSIRSQILVMQPLPTVNQAYSMMIQEESQRSHLSVAVVPDSMALYSSSAASSKQKRFSGTCDYCKIKGYKKDQCYRLIGFPPNYKFSKKKTTSNVVANSTVSVDLMVVSTRLNSIVCSPPLFTQEQYEQILQLLNKQPAESAVNLADYSLDNVLVVPQFKHNLLSVSRLTHDLGCYFTFYPDFFLLQDLCTGRMKGIGRLGHAALSTLNKIDSLQSVKFQHDLVHKCSNGVAERKHRHILEVARALCFHSNVPIKFWGYSATQKGYILFNIDLKTFFVNRNVIFHEDVFPFKFASSNQSFFPPHPDILDYDFLQLSFPSSLNQTPSSDSVLPSASSKIPTNPSSTNSEYLSNASTDVVPIIIPQASVPNTETTRTSSRISKPPSWLHDYVHACQSTSPSGQYPISYYISYSHLPKHTQSFVLSVSHFPEPKTFQEVQSDPRWIKAMQEEIHALELNKTWSLIPLPPGKVCI
ncbi:uncharacterized protein LOC120176179 [Hibiscus syriacus]|uniref:uncharacterized protein LOC120176179 n=1 Tax=Hibiscus syriacus TaxID=106335 RepID=UPI001920F0E3|nr:uncharacterized protein LOC120176179 [Hibiscus syriacus]